MFNDFYGIYKGARDGSWRFLIDYKINALPIDFNIVAKAMNIKIRQDTQGILLPTERGATITDGTRTYILLKPSSIQAMRYTCKCPCSGACKPAVFGFTKACGIFAGNHL